VAVAQLVDLLERLEVPRDQPLYVQSSADWLERAGFDAVGSMKALLSWIGTLGTLVMPTYPFATSHLEYLAAGPFFDVRRTPAATGLIPEMLRRSAGAIRSLDPDFCVTALGADAVHIAGELPDDPDPFGPDSCYQRMLDRRTTLIGLGVSLNTTSFIHLIDSRAEHRYPRSVFDDRSFEATVIDRTGRSHTVVRKALRPDFQQLSRPSAIVDAMRPLSSTFATAEINDARFFRWDLPAWSAWCLDHAREQPAGQWPCWLTRLATAATT
jgi:aminoglycoside N3'-acetyltransferase